MSATRVGEAHVDDWDSDATLPDDVNPRLVEDALASLSSHDRAVLDLGAEYTLEEAADFFEVPAHTFRRWLTTARRRLVDAYQRLSKGGLVIVAALLRAITAARRRIGETRAVSWARAVPHAMEALTASSATAFALVTGLAVGGVILLDGPTRERLGVRRDPPAPVPFALDRLPSAQDGVIEVPHGGQAERPRAAPLVVLYPAPARHPEERAVGLEAPSPVAPPKAATDLGISPGPVGVGLSYHCPPSDARPAVLEVVCSVVGSGT